MDIFCLSMLCDTWEGKWKKKREERIILTNELVWFTN
jgi:hypothetical protein